MTSTVQEPTSEASQSPLEPSDGDSKAFAPPTTFARPPYYTRRTLLLLAKSPHVAPPPGMPQLKDWFGDWNEQQPARKDVDTNGSTRARYRNHADDSDQPPRETTSRPFKPTFSQATQMGSFRHQPIKLDLGDRDNSERLRNLSDKYDRDRSLRSADGLGSGSSPSALTLPQTSRRDTTPHLTGRQSTTSLSSTATSATRKTNNERDRESPFTNRAETNGRRVPSERTGPEGRGERSDDWRKASGPKDEWEPRDRDRPNERERTRDRDRRSRSRDPKREEKRDKDERKDGDHAGWTVATGERDRRRNARERDRDRDEEDSTGRERAGRRGGDRERDKDKEPAWMDDWVPDSNSKTPGKGFGILSGEGGLDGLQAWKKEMKEKEKEKERDGQKEKAIPSPSVNDLAPADTLPTNGMNDIEKFKLAMKESQAQKDKAKGKQPTSAEGPPPGLPLVSEQLGFSADPAIVQSHLPADPAIIQSYANPTAILTDSAISTNNNDVSEKPSPHDPSRLGSISLKSLGLAPGENGLPPTRMTNTANSNAVDEASQDAMSTFKNLLTSSGTPPAHPLTPSHIRTSSTDPTRLLNNSMPTQPNSPSTVDTRSSSRNALGKGAEGLGEFGKPLSSAGILDTSPVNNNPNSVSTSAMGRSKFAKFFQSQERDPAAGPNVRNSSNSAASPNSSMSLQNHDSLLNLTGNGLGQHSSLGAAPSGLSMMDHNNNAHLMNSLAQGQGQSAAGVQALLASLSMSGGGPKGGSVDRTQIGGVPTGGSMEGIFAALAASKGPGPRPPSGSGFGQSNSKISQAPSPHGFAQQHQHHPQQLQMPHIPPPNTQLPFNPSSQNDLTDGGKFVPNGMVPGLGPPRRDSSIGNSGDLDERDRYGFNLSRVPPQTQQQLFEQQQQQQQQLHQLRGVPQPIYASQGPNRGGMGVIPPQFRHGPSPIGGQNPSSNGGQHQRGLSAMGGMMRPNPQELAGVVANAGGGGMVGMGLPGLRGIGPEVVRNPHELGMRAPQDLNPIQGMMRSELSGPFGINQQQFAGPQQLPQQNALPPGHILNGPSAGGPVRIGPPGSADFLLHTQQLQAARAAAAAQQQQQMMQHLGLRNPAPQALQQQPQQLRPAFPQHLLPHNVSNMNQQQQLNALNQVGMGQHHPNDFGPAGYPAHAGHVGGGLGPASQGPEAFLQLFMNGSAGHRE